MVSSRTTVLVIDDFADALEIYCTYLSFKGFDVLSASNGLDGVALARERRPDIVLMDLRMPGMTGTEAMLELRADPSFNTVPIIALTAHAFRETREDALRAGFDVVISKPCLPDELVEVVTQLLSSWHRSE